MKRSAVLSTFLILGMICAVIVVMERRRPSPPPGASLDKASTAQEGEFVSSQPPVEESLPVRHPVKILDSSSSSSLDLLQFHLDSLSGPPAAGARVTVANIASSISQTFFSDQAGEVRGEFPKGACMIEASFPQDSTFSHYYLLSSLTVGDFPIKNTMVIPGPAVVTSVLVLDRMGPVPNIAVALTASETMYKSRTDETGTATFAELFTGRVVVKVGDLIAPIAREVLDLSTSLSTVIVVRLLGPSLTVKLSESGGLGQRTCVGLERIDDLKWASTRFWYVTPDSVVHAQNLEPGGYLLSIAARDPYDQLEEPESYACKVYRLDVGDQDILINHVLEPSPIVELRVEDSEGHLVNSARVRIEQESEGVSYVDSISPITWSSRKNSGIRMPVGEATLKVDSPRYGYGELNLACNPGELSQRTIRLVKNSFALNLTIPLSMIPNIRSVWFYNHSDLLITKWAPSRSGVNLDLPDEDPAHEEDSSNGRKEFYLGYCEGGTVRLSVLLKDGNRFNIIHELWDGGAIAIEVQQ